MKFLKIDLKNRQCNGLHYVADERISDGTVSKSYDGYVKPFKIRLTTTHQVDGKKKFKRKFFAFPPALKDVDGVPIKTTYNIKDNRFNRKIVAGMTLNQAIDYINLVERSKLSDTFINSTDADQNKTITLKEAFYEYMQIKIDNKKLREHTALNYEKYFEKHLSSLHDKPVEQITQSDLNKVKKKLHRDGLAPRTIKTLKECLSPMFNYYITDKSSLVDHNPTANLIFEELDNERVLDLSNDERKQLFKAVYNYHDVVFRSIFIWCFCGRRKGEVLGLQWKHINLTDKKKTIGKVILNKNEYTVPKEISKPKKDLDFKLHPLQLETLEWMQERADQLGYTIKQSDYIFPSITDPHKQMHKDTPNRHWENILKSIGLHNRPDGDKYLDNPRIHDTRTIIASYLAEDDEENEKFAYVDQEIGTVLGHIPTGVTKRYIDTRKGIANRLLKEFIDWISND